MFNYIEKLDSIEQFKTLKEENEKIVFDTMTQGSPLRVGGRIYE